MSVQSDFVLLKELEHPILLGAPFLTTISPMTVDKDGIIGTIKGKGRQVFFKLCMPSLSSQILHKD